MEAYFNIKESVAQSSTIKYHFHDLIKIIHMNMYRVVKP